MVDRKGEIMRFISNIKDSQVEVRLSNYNNTVELFIADCLVGRFMSGKLQLFDLSKAKIEKLAALDVEFNGKYNGLSDSLCYLKVTQL